jgi:hypothetical protein
LNDKPQNEMKKITLGLLCSIFLLGDSYAKQIPVVTISYTKNCLICGSTTTKTLIETTLPDGQPYVFWGRRIICSWGFGGCPENSADAPILNENPDWISNASNELFNYAALQIGNGVNSGNHSSNVFNTNLNQLFRFMVNWSSNTDDSGNPIESIIVTFEPID